jgi:hypothetical protein
MFVEKVRDIVGLYLNPPDKARTGFSFLLSAFAFHMFPPRPSRESRLQFSYFFGGNRPLGKYEAFMAPPKLWKLPQRLEWKG